jgi:hypothetical protein
MAVQQSLAHVRRQFLSGAWEVATEAQYILEAECSGVYVRPPEFPAATIRSLQASVQPYFRTMRIPCAQLKAHGYGDYSLSIGVLSAQYFESRDEFDRLYADLWLTESDKEEEEEEEKTHAQSKAQPKLTPVKVADEISLVTALAEHFHVTLSCNMDYYSTHPQTVVDKLPVK